MNWWAQKQKGFTIVELLIVIVVIAILAAISVVAYNGIQARSENTKTIQAVSQYIKAFHGYAAVNDTYPVETGYPCLGTVATCGQVSGATYCLGSGTASNNASFDGKVKTILTALPEPSVQKMNCGGVLASGAYYVKNDASVGKGAQVIYFLRGDQPCDKLSGVAWVTRMQLDDTTRCYAGLPTLP